MLLRSDAVQSRIKELPAQTKAGAIAPLEAAEKMLAVAPGQAPETAEPEKNK